MKNDDAEPLTLLRSHPKAEITRSQLAILCSAIFLKGGLLGAYTPFSALWLSKKGYSPTDMGVVALVDAACSLLLPVAGCALDKLRAHNMGFVAMLVALTALKCAYLLVARSFVAILVLTALTAPLIRASNTILDALALYAFAERGHFSKVRLVGDVGFGVNAVTVGVAMQVSGTEDAIYWVFAGICASLAVLWTVASPCMGSITPDRKAMPWVEFLAQVRLLCSTVCAQEGVARAFLLLCAIGGLLGLVATFEFVLLDDMMGSSLLLGLCKLTGTICSIPAWWFVAPLMDRIGLNNVLILGLCAAGLRILVLGLIRNPWYALFSEALSGVGGFALAYSSMTIFMGRMVEEDMKGTAQTVIYTVFAGFGAGVAPLLGSLIVTGHRIHGIQNMFLVAVALVAALLMGILAYDLIALARSRARQSQDNPPETSHP